MQKWQKIAQAIISYAAEHQIKALDIRQVVFEGITQVDLKVAMSLLSIPSQEVNRGYQTPSDTKARTSTWYPLIAKNEYFYFVQPRSIAIRSFCENISSMLRKEQIHDLENRMGKALELATLKMLSRHGISALITNKKYGNKSTSFELDIVFETDECIYLIECTKKPLTTTARGGNVLSALKDLEGSFIKLLQQLSRHEEELSVKGRIQFTDGSILHRNGRRIEKIGINLFDHGSLQNRDFTIALVERLAGAVMSADSAEAQDTVKSINKRLEKINSSLENIFTRANAGDQRFLFRFAMSIWWLSIDQFDFVISKGGGDLGSSLQKLRHLTARSGDIVYEMKRCENLNPVGRALLEVTAQMDSRGMI